MDLDNFQPGMVALKLKEQGREGGRGREEAEEEEGEEGEGEKGRRGEGEKGRRGERKRWGERGRSGGRRGGRREQGHK